MIFSADSRINPTIVDPSTFLLTKYLCPPKTLFHVKQNEMGSDVGSGTLFHVERGISLLLLYSATSRSLDVH